MFRAVVNRAARRPVITAGTRLPRTYPLRWNSSQPPLVNASPPKGVSTPEELAKKAALKKQDEQLRDWNTKEVKYEELLLKTQSPSSVSQGVFLCVL
jgi:hypothetical protein